MKLSALLRAAAIALLVGVALPRLAHAHTVSVGYENAGPGSVTFWYGTYHFLGDGPNTEGSMTLVGINGTDFAARTVPFTLSTGVKPGGLIDGTTNSYAPGYNNSRVKKWQGVTFAGLAAGTYQFTYQPIQFPSASWAPINEPIRTATVIVSEALIIAAPIANAGTDVTVNQGDRVTLDGSASHDGNTPAKDITFAWAQQSGPTAIDFTGTATATPSFTVPSVPATGGALVFKLTVSNGASLNPGTDTVTVNVRGNNPPVANAGPAQTVSAGADCTALVTVNGSGTDAEGSPLTYAWSGPFGTIASQSATVALPIGSHTLTLAVTDNLGATGTSTVSIVVRDDTAPTLTVPDAITTVTQPGKCGALVAFSPVANDTCSAVTVVSTPASGSLFPVGTTVVNTVATDAAGNSVSKSFTVTVRDTEAPVIVAPADLNLIAGNTGVATADFAAQASDNCSGVTVAYSRASGSAFNVGTTIVTATATDASGNTAATTFKVTVKDTTPPTITTPAASPSVETDGTTRALTAWLASNGGAAATDNASAVTWSNNFTALTASCGSTGATTVIFTATDASGNASTTTATFTYVDTTAPAITTAASAKTVETDGAGNTAALTSWLASNGGAAATDAGSAVTWSNDYTAAAFAKSCGSTGSATVTFTATDACGNKSTTKAAFTIVDHTKPTVVAGSNKVVESDGAGNTAALAAWLAANSGAAATDVGSAVTWTNDYSATSFVKSCGTAGTATVTFTATDACGNASSTTATFTIVDTTKPVLASDVYDIAPNIKPVTFTVTSTDIGSIATPTITKVTATRLNGAGKTLDKTADYKHTIAGNRLTIEITGGVDTVWTIYAAATDECGNSTTATYVVTVRNPSGK